MPFQPDKNAALAHRLYSALIMGTHRLHDVAERMGEEYDTVRAWCVNRSALPANRLANLYRATLDLDLWAELAGARSLGLTVTLPPVGVASGDDVLRVAARTEVQAGKVLDFAERATDDGVITAAELEELDGLVSLLMRKAQALRERARAAQAGTPRGAR